MGDFLIESKNKTQLLNPGKTMEIDFEVKNTDGKVTGIANANGIIPFDPTKRLIEIFEPNNPKPVNSKSDIGLSPTTVLSQNVSKAGTWKVRVTNQEDSTEIFKLSVSYPGTIPLKTVSLPISVINTFFNLTLNQVKIHLDNGGNNSFIKFPALLGIPELRFTVPDYKYTIELWILPDIVFNEKISDINSLSVAAALENSDIIYRNGSIKMKVKFETNGLEIKGTVDANIGNMDLTVELGLTVRNGKITYQTNNIGIDFPITIDFVQVPDILEDFVDAIVGYRKKIRAAVENAIENIFSSPTTIQVLANTLDKEVKKVLGENIRIYSVRVIGGNLIVKYYTI